MADFPDRLSAPSSRPMPSFSARLQNVAVHGVEVPVAGRDRTRHHQQERRLGSTPPGWRSPAPRPTCAAPAYGPRRGFSTSGSPRATRRQQQGQGLALATCSSQPPPFSMPAENATGCPAAATANRAGGTRLVASRSSILRDLAGGEPHHVDVLAARFDLPLESSASQRRSTAVAAGGRRAPRRAAPLDHSAGTRRGPAACLGSASRPETIRTAECARGPGTNGLTARDPTAGQPDVMARSIANARHCAERRGSTPVRSRAQRSA